MALRRCLPVEDAAKDTNLARTLTLTLTLTLPRALTRHLAQCLPVEDAAEVMRDLKGVLDREEVPVAP